MSAARINCWPLAAIVGKDGDTDAAGDRQGLTRNGKRFAQLIEYLLRQLRRIIWVGADGKNHEFVAPQTGDRIAGAQHASQALGDAAQQLVADGVAERVVDHLEAIKIEEQQQTALVVALRLFHGVLDAVVKQQAVRQAGQRIMMRHVIESLLRIVNGRHIGKGGHKMRHHAIRVAHDTDAEPGRKHNAILALATCLTVPETGRIRL